MSVIASLVDAYRTRNKASVLDENLLEDEISVCSRMGLGANNAIVFDFEKVRTGDATHLASLRSLLGAAGAGYATGQGGAVTQITSSSTAVTLNKYAGKITTVALTTAAGAEEIFTVNCDKIGANDTISFGTTYAGNGTPAITAKKIVGGTSFDIVVTNLHASAALNAAMEINFTITKGAAA